MSGEERLPFRVARALAVNAIWWFRPARDLVNRWVRPYQGGMGGAELADYIESQIEKNFTLAGIDLASLAGKTVLEIGPGGNFGLAAVVLAHGAERVVCLDRDRLCFDSGMSLSLYRELDRRFGGRLAPLVEVAGDRVRLPEPRFEYCVNVPMEKAPYPDGSFDFIYSCACLEHVVDPDSALRQMYRLLRPGGRMLHEIDFRDHRDFTRPLEFLRYSETFWRFLSRGSELNRWRLSQYRAALARAGFSTTFEALMRDELSGVRVRPEYLSEIRPHLHPAFASLPDEDLSTLGAVVVAEKPG